MRLRLPILALAAAAMFVLSAPISSASAHHLGSAHTGPAKGLSIPGLTHGQMVVIAAHRSAILELAARQTPTDPVMRRLQGYINLQFFACMWGIVPGGVSDETSPFNECSHAYLAGARALLIHLLTMQGERAPIRALADKIELEMLPNNASLVMCRFSDEPFDTAEIIGPHWGDIPFHPISCLWFLGLALATAGCAWAAARWKPRHA
jgi:hypothetical protein